VSRWTALAALMAVLASPGSLAAQDAPTPPDVPPGEDRIESLTLRAPAPFAGMLLDTDTAIRWTHRLEWYRAELQLQLRTSSSILEAERRSHGTELTLTRESFEREITGLREDLRTQATRYEEELARLRAPEPFWESWGFAFGMGVVLVGAIVGVTAGVVASL
jgi:hypothetical protein